LLSPIRVVRTKYRFDAIARVIYSHECRKSAHERLRVFGSRHSGRGEAMLGEEEIGVKHLKDGGPA